MSETTLTKTQTYSIDPAHSTARFWVRHLMIAKVHGEISDITGSVSLNRDAPEQTTIEATIQVASLTTSNEQRDGHLKSADFLDAANHPTITFKSKTVSKKGPNNYEVVGDLTIRGTTKEVALQAEVTDEIKSPFGGYKVGISATGVIDREKFGVTWNQALETGGVMVGNEIHLQIDAELDRAE